MKVRAPSGVLVGQALDLRDSALRADRLLSAIRRPADPLVDCAPPSSLHSHLGHVHDGMSLDRRDAVVAAGRSLGRSSPYREDIRRLEKRIEAIPTDAPDLAAARKRAASAGASVDALRERVARLSGRLNAKREADEPTAAVEASLREATRELSEAETDAIAAGQTLAAAETAAQEARDRRSERLSLVDRRDNLRRRERAWLVDQVLPALRPALASLPVPAFSASTLDSYAGRDVDLALGLARIGRPRAPVLIEDGPFETAVRARAAVGSPVLLV